MADEWYADGLRFQCTQCGNCCTGPEGAVWFTEEEGRRMADRVGLDESTFLRRHARRLAPGWSLKERKTAYGFDCVFLDRTLLQVLDERREVKVRLGVVVF